MTDPNTSSMSPSPTPSTETAPSPGRRRWLSIVVAILALAAGGLLVRPILRALGPAPPLAPGLRLVAEGKYLEARPELERYLAYDPSNVPAGLAMAETLLALPALELAEPTPEDIARRSREALARLAAIRPAGRLQIAHSLLLRGRAFEAMGQLGPAEESWNAALRADPLVSEAGWLLLQLYYGEGREDEARRLGLRLSTIEPDPRDRVRLILEAARYDAEPRAAAGVLRDLGPAHLASPEEPHSALAYFRAMASEGKDVDAAIAGLRDLVARRPDDLDAWDALFTALGNTGHLDPMGRELAKVPKSLAEDPRIARHRGRLAMDRGEFAGAVADLRKAVAARPSDIASLHRLGDALKLSGQLAEAETVKAREADFEDARKALRGITATNQESAQSVAGLFSTAMNNPRLGLVPDLDLYRKFANVRERMGHPDEALAWHRLILQELPEDPESKAAVARLAPAS